MSETQRPPANVFVRTARKIYEPLGIAKGRDFALSFTLLGVLIAFTLSRLQFLDFNGVFCSTTVKSSLQHAAPGECFYWLQQPYKTGILLHLATILPAALLVCVQFVPVIRRKAPFIHRINGYLVIALSVVSMAGTLVITPRTMGGGLDIQGFLCILTAAFLGALLKGYLSIKQGKIHAHRAWMLRAWSWAGSIISGRLIHFLILRLQQTPSYYEMPCDKIDFLLHNRTIDAYPQCASFYSGENSQQKAPVLTDFNSRRSFVEAAAALNSTFAMAYAISLLLHILATEVYLHLTSHKPREASSKN
ncbi:hypothetical protein F4808DRAFT_461128 [Astrocystis sublimbata]|nr:hypothetical protein F4808DRAFT_461128 [Astrocystis sublimbata]